MRLVDQWEAIESEVTAGGRDAHVRLHISDPTQAERATQMLGALNPIRRETTVDVHITTPELVQLRWALRGLDKRAIGARLELLHMDEGQPAAAPEPRRSLAADWDRELEALPDDWNDLVALVELQSSDQLARASLLMSPCNPTREGVGGLRFRCASRSGYGAAPSMVRRSLARLDEDDIRGTVRVLMVLSETDHVDTQGPLFYVRGRAV